ncbi:MAG: MBOAT family protein [Acidobacteria bacterium]|nr:MBOAT family protein [Acidobacteriota bacterium]
MLLTSSAYFLFLAAIFFLYWPLSRWRAAGLAVVLFANYFFYARWDLRYLAIVPLASSADYWIGRALPGSAYPRLLAGASIALNIGLLAVLKFSTGSWALPLGLSFYCFQALTYTLDIYRKDARPGNSYLAHLTAVSFFPTILAGPITRVDDLLKQMERPAPGLTDADAGRGFFLIGLGALKKFLVADYLAENLVNRVFDFPALYTGTETLVAVYAYALQLYYDFSGYTDVALGSALLLGIRLPANFNQPYLAANVSDFWRRWHISLSNWLRDYLFFSLPAKRHAVMPYVNLIVTMVIGGLWHGASWTFAFWGLLHGAGQAVSRYFQSRRGRAEPRTPRWIRVFVTVQFVCFGWIFFRASSWDNAWLVVERIGSLSMGWDNISNGIWLILGIALAGHYAPKGWLDAPRERFASAPFYAQAAALLLLAMAIRYVAATGAAPFIYTKF